MLYNWTKNIIVSVQISIFGNYVEINADWNKLGNFIIHIERRLRHWINSYLISGDCCRLLITFDNSFDTDQDRQNVGPDLNTNCLTLW